MPFLKDKPQRPLEPRLSDTCLHKNALYQPDHTHKFCPDCTTWLLNENHPDNQPKADEQLN